MAAALYDFNSRNHSNYPIIFAAILGAVQGSLLLYTLPGFLGGAERIILQDLIFTLYFVLVLISLKGSLSNIIASPIIFASLVLLVFDSLAQLFIGSANQTWFLVFREARILAYFVVPLICFSAVNKLDKVGATKNHIVTIFIFSGLGSIIYTIIAKYFVAPGGSLTYFSSAAEAMDSGFSHALRDKFKSPPITVAFLSAYFFSNFLSQKERPLWSYILSLTMLVALIWLSISSNTRSLIGACAVGVISPLLGIAARATVVGRVQLTGTTRSIIALGILATAAYFTVLSPFGAIFETETFKSQVTNKSFINDKSDAVRLESLLSVITLDYEAPLGSGLGTGSTFASINGLMINPIDSGFFHSVNTFGFQFLTPYLITHIMALAFSLRLLISLGRTSPYFSYASGLTSALLVGIFSFYQFSPFLFTADSLLLGCAIGSSLFISHNVSRRHSAGS